MRLLRKAKGCRQNGKRGLSRHVGALALFAILDLTKVGITVLVKGLVGKSKDGPLYARYLGDQMAHLRMETRFKLTLTSDRNDFNGQTL